jgi:hypothetical protein
MGVCVTNMIGALDEATAPGTGALTGAGAGAGAGSDGACTGGGDAAGGGAAGGDAAGGEESGGDAAGGADGVETSLASCVPLPPPQAASAAAVKNSPAHRLVCADMHPPVVL